MSANKQPISVLVVIHTSKNEILMLERSAHPGFWQSVTGSREGEDSLRETARREVHEETGINAPIEQFRDWSVSNTFEIFAEWRHRYAPGITQNVEHVFSLMVSKSVDITIAPNEHRQWCWQPQQEAARQCFSWSNRDAILMLPAPIASLP